MTELEIVEGPRDEAGVQKDSISFMSANNRSKLVGYLWHAPDAAHRGVLQLVHGMIEYIDRYDRFARVLAQEGYVVVGHDQVGHGGSVKKPEEWGHLEPGIGARVFIDDVHSLRLAMVSRYPDLPYYLFGHSMGSFIVRNYIQGHSDGLSGALICGTGWEDEKALRGGILLCKLMGTLKGYKSKLGLLDKMTLGAYDGAFPDEGKAAWLTKDLAIRKQYLHDPRSTFRFSIGGFHELFSLIKQSQNKKLIAHTTKSLPLFILSGEEDPVGEMGKGPVMLYEVLEQLGFTDVTLKLYPHDRHEILNETNYDEVDHDIISWLERRYQE